MIQPDATLEVHREPFGTRAEWSGGRYARFFAPMFVLYGANPPEPGKLFRVGGIRLQIVERIFEAGSHQDCWIVARAEDPIAWLCGAYRRTVMTGLQLVYRCEAAYLAFRLKYREGERAQFTGWLAGKLL